MSMMDMMGGGAPAPPEAAPAPAPEGGGDQAGQVQEILNIIQEMLTETQDPDVQAAFSQAETALTKLVMSLQKEKDAAMGTTPAHKYVARQQSSGGGEAAGGY